MYKHILVSLVLASLLPFAAQATTSYTVTTNTDELDTSPSCLTANVSGSGGDNSNTDCSLREAINLADNNSSDQSLIIVPAGTYNLTILNGGANDGDENIDGDLDFINTTKKVTVQGASTSTTIISGQGSTTNERVFDVAYSNVSVTLQDLTIRDGYANIGDGQDGGGVANLGNLTLDSVLITSNNATTLGGGIYNALGATVTIVDSVISSNTTVGSGAGIVNVGTATITSSEIKANILSSPSSDVAGGGIFNAGTLTISLSEVSNNTAVGSDAVGLGIYSGGAFTNTITNSTIASNTAASGGVGGGVYLVLGTTLSLVNDTIVNNTAAVGGGIVGPATLTGSIVANNTASVSDVDCYGALTSGGYNIIETVSSHCTGLSADTTNLLNTDPQINPVPTVVTGPDYFTFMQASTSAAVNVIPSAACITALGSTPTDQLGNTRRGYCDVGAYEYQDNVTPAISLINDNSTYNTSECGATYRDPLALALDDIDGDISSSLLPVSTVDTTTPGSYTITYTVADLSTNISSPAVRTVTISDTTVPVVTLSGSTPVYVSLNATYTDAGATAADGCDTAVSVATTNPVNTATAGTYTVSYSATDDSNNIGTATRSVVVVAAITDVTQTDDGSLVTTDEEGNTTTFDPFPGDEYVYTVMTDNIRIVATNGKFVRVFVNGERIAQKKINQKKLRSRFLKLKVRKLYSSASYDDVMVLLAKTHKGKVNHIRLSPANRLVKLHHKLVNITHRRPSKIIVKARKHRFISRFGRGSSKVQSVWKVTRRGILKAVN